MLESGEEGGKERCKGKTLDSGSTLKKELLLPDQGCWREGQSWATLVLEGFHGFSCGQGGSIGDWG